MRDGPPVTSVTDVERPPLSGDSTAFILELGRALEKYGTPAHQVESTLTTICRKVGLRGEFFSTPTSLMAMIEERRRGDLTAHLIRIRAGDIQLGKLSAVDRIADEVVDGRMSFAEAHEQLETIRQKPNRQGLLLTLSAYALAPASVAHFLGGGWLELVTGAGVGVLIGALSILIGTRTPHTLEFVASFVASASAVLAAHEIGANPAITTLSAVIMLVPGLSLTLAMSELAQRELVSGTARLMSALIVLLEMGIGVGMARRLLPAPPDILTTATALPSGWAGDIALVGPIVSSVVVFQVPRDAIPAVAVISAVGFYGARLGASLIGAELGPWLGAFGIGVACNTYARVFNRPATVPLVPALVLLVPGSLSLSGLTAMIDAAEMLSGMEAMVSAILVAASIVAGLLTANVLVPARRIL